MHISLQQSTRLNLDVQHEGQLSLSQVSSRQRVIQSQQSCACSRSGWSMRPCANLLWLCGDHGKAGQKPEICSDVCAYPCCTPRPSTRTRVQTAPHCARRRHSMRGRIPHSVLRSGSSTRADDALCFAAFPRSPRKLSAVHCRIVWRCQLALHAVPLARTTRILSLD